MAKKYNDARAVKVEKTTAPKEVTVSKKTVKKIKKSPVLIILIVCLLIGAAGGFFAGKKLSYFRLGGFTVNGVAAEENDYVEIDLTSIKEKLENERTAADNADPVTAEDIKAALTVNDGGAEISFFGKSVGDTVTCVLYYREDKTHDIEKVDEIDYTKAGIYYEEYTSSHFAFSSAKLIRTIIVTGVEQDG